MKLDAYYSSNVTINYAVYDTDVSGLLENLKQNHKSKIIIQCRLYRKMKLPYSLFGDELITELEITTKAEIDIFSKTYKITYYDETLFFEKKEDFLDHYFNYQIIIPASSINVNDLEFYYVKIKLTLIDKEYIEPFNIFYLTKMLNRNTTGWLHMDLKQEKDDF